MVVAVGTVVALPAAQPALADAAGQGGDYVPINGTDVRVLDTANGVGTTKGVRGPASTTLFQVTGVGAVPTTNVKAVMVDITAKAPTANTWLTLWKGDESARPGVGTINVVTGEQISNSAVVEVGANGKLNLYNSAGNVNVLVDVLGYFTNVRAASGPGGFVPVPSNPTLVSTGGGVGTPAGTIPAGGSRTVNLLGGIVPAGSTAVFVDLQVGSATQAGWVETAPTGGTGHSSSLEFAVGTTSSGAMIRIAADGRANIVNHSTAAINVLVRLLGYFTNTNATGAGLRPIARRLIDTTLPANGSIDVAVGGTNGLPIKGIAGVALNFTAAAPTESGYFKSWGVGNTEPGSSVSTWNADKQRGGMAIIKPGTDGKIRVRSVSTGTVRLVVDLQGWFAEPITPLPIAQYAATTVFQTPPAAGATVGALEYSYVDNIGVIRLGHQTNVDFFGTGSVQWSTAAADGSFTGQTGASVYTDGRFQVTALRTTGDYWTASQKTAGGADFNPWGGFGGSMVSSPTQITLSTGTTINLAVDSDGALWHHRVVTGTTSYWRNLGDQDLVGPVTAVPVAQGQQLFARDTSGAVRTVLYANDGTMGAWVNLGGNNVTDRPAVVAYPGPRLRAVVHAADGTIQTKIQNTDGSWPADWETVGGTFTFVGAPAAILDPVLGRTALVARGTDNEIYAAFETSAGSGTWGQWNRVSENSDPAASDPTVTPVRNGSGQSWLIVWRNPNDATRVFWRDPATTPPAGKSKAATSGPVTFTGHTLPAPPKD
ncbi:hypothetical protein [Actinoplanes sp. NBRC 103695]|uniref:hypothetical protein n=1 Tax=Actinoplanes sp. NBRC 103695 TaxID=3032202 RepID=UPI0025535B6A|nr:hypothetical protein [Actinoplanes sp. NBRC 103695]